MITHTVRHRIAFNDLKVSDRVCFKSRRGMGGAGIGGLLYNTDGSLKGFRLEGEPNPGVYYYENQFVAGYRDVPMEEPRNDQCTCKCQCKNV